MSKTFKIVGEDISDGYHTFDELYEHRIALYVALAYAHGCSAYYTTPKDGWFVLFLELPTGQVSYHLPEKWIETVSEFASRSDDHKWDGHASPQVLERLKQYAEGTYQ